MSKKAGYKKSKQQQMSKYVVLGVAFAMAFSILAGFVASFI